MRLQTEVSSNPCLSYASGVCYWKCNSLAPSDVQERLACLIVAHNLGDAVIQSRFLALLAAAGYARNYLVWTRPQVAFLFEDVPDCRIVCSQFPIGTDKQFGVRA